MAYLLSPVVAWLSSKNFPLTQKKIPWSFATLVVYFLAVGIFSALLLLLVPLLFAQIEQLASSFPIYLQNAENSFEKLKIWYVKLHIPPSVEANLKLFGKSILEKTIPVLSSIGVHLVGGMLDVVAAFFVFLSAFLVSLYIVLDEKNIKSHFLEIFPKSWQEDTEELMINVGHVVGAFIRGEIVVSFIAGAASYFALLLLKLAGIQFQYALLSGTLIAFLYPIPFIGVWLPRLLIPMLAYFQLGNGLFAILIFGALTGVGIVVDNVVLPAVMGKGVGISPLIVLLAIFAGGELFGIWGLILGVPAAAVLRLIFLYLQKRITI